MRRPRSRSHYGTGLLAGLLSLWCAACGAAGQLHGVTVPLPFTGRVDPDCVRATMGTARGIDSVTVTETRATQSDGDYLLHYVARNDTLGATLVVDQRVYPDGTGTFLASYLVAGPAPKKGGLGRYRRAAQSVLSRIKDACGVTRRD